jgi:hypothetical protein
MLKVHALVPVNDICVALARVHMRGDALGMGCRRNDLFLCPDWGGTAAHALDSGIHI